VSDAAVKSQWPRQSIQVVEELCNEEEKNEDGDLKISTMMGVHKHPFFTRVAYVRVHLCTPEELLYLYSPLRGCLPPPNTRSCTGHCW